MLRGFFFFLQLKNRHFKRSRGRQSLWVCFDVEVEALLGVWVWLEMCTIIFSEPIFRQSTIFRSECYISFASLQRQFNLLNCEWMCVCARVGCVPLFLNSWLQLPQALSNDFFFFFLSPPKSLLNQCTWTWSVVCRPKAAVCVWNHRRIRLDCLIPLIAKR